MIQPGMMFGSEGPIMTGTWYNPTNGDAFTVRDSFFEDNQYVVTTTDGRYLQYSQLQNYVQTDMKLEDLKKANSENNVKEEIPLEVSSLIENSNDSDSLLLPEDAMLIKPNSLGNLADSRNTHTTSVTNNNYPIHDSTPTNMNTAIIEKALKNTAKPNFSIYVKWNNYPTKEIEMLKDIMDISMDEIIDWYMDNIQLNDFITAFRIALNEKIMNGNNPAIEESAIHLPEPEEVIIIKKPEIVSSDSNDGGALAKEPKNMGGPKATRAGRKPVNKKKE